MTYRTIATLTFATLMACSSAAGASEWVLPPGASFNNTPPAQLSNEWWQWARATPDDINPLLDQTGTHCASGQQGAVWFLAGGFGSARIRRVCTIPSGKALFFPVINMVHWRSNDSRNYTCNQAKAAAALNNETALDLFAELDGVAINDIQKYRVRSARCFNIFGRVPKSENPYNAFPSASDGYWLLLKPLPKGHHTLKFGGRYNRNSVEFGRMVQDIEYELIVQ